MTKMVHLSVIFPHPFGGENDVSIFSLIALIGERQAMPFRPVVMSKVTLVLSSMGDDNISQRSPIH